MKITKVCVASGAVFAALAVVLGAFGAHALRHDLSSKILAVWETAVHYQFLHALGMIAIGLTAAWRPGNGYRWAAWLMGAGIVLFSGSLYLLCLTTLRWLGLVTPFGGMAFIAAWLVYAVTVWRS